MTPIHTMREKSPPDAGGKHFLQPLNSSSLTGITGCIAPSLAAAQPNQKFQFERHGYFVAERKDHRVGGKVAFNRVTGLKDSWPNNIQGDSNETNI